MKPSWPHLHQIASQSPHVQTPSHWVGLGLYQEFGRNIIQSTAVDNIIQSSSLGSPTRGEEEQLIWTGLQFQMYKLEKLK